MTVRRAFVSLCVLLAWIVALGADVRPTSQQLEWADCEIGVIIHQDLQVYCPEYNHRVDGNEPSPSVFNPSALDTDQWIRTAKSAGAKYAILVAKHCSGFSLWPTKAHDFSVARSSWKGGKGDVVADFIASCRKYGIRPGIYASACYNAHLGVRGADKDYPQEKWTGYFKVLKTQLTELWTNYGELFEIWFDGGNIPTEKGGREIDDLLISLQPNAVVFQGNPDRMSTVRWIGNERAQAPEVCWCRDNMGTTSDGLKEARGEVYSGSPNGRFWCPGEADMPNRDQNYALQGGWFWREGDDQYLYSPDELMDCYFTSVGRNCNLLLGMVIDNRGLVPDADARQFEAFGRKVRALYANCAAEAAGEACRIAHSGCLEEAYELSVPKGARPNVLSLQEDLRGGERVKGFSLRGYNGQCWRTLANGANVGHRALVRFRAGDYEKYRIQVGVSKAEGRALRSIGLYEEK